MKVLLNSPADTPDSDKMFVIENTSVSREKKRYGDIITEINFIDEQTVKMAERKVVLEDIKTKMDKLLE